MRKVYYIIATVFGLGRLPLCPGTWGSLAGLVFCIFLNRYPLIYSIFFFLTFFIGLIAAGKVESDSAEKDPGYIVIDEFACIFPVFFIIPLKIPYLLTGFVLYRLFDIIKVPPARAFEKIKGGWGIMLDDLVAGIYSGVILHIIAYFQLF